MHQLILNLLLLSTAIIRDVVQQRIAKYYKLEEEARKIAEREAAALAAEAQKKAEEAAAKLAAEAEMKSVSTTAEGDDAPKGSEAATDDKNEDGGDE